MYIKKELLQLKEFRGFKAEVKRDLEFKRGVVIDLIVRELNKRFYFEHIDTLQGLPRWGYYDRMDMIYYYLGLLRLVVNGDKKEINNIYNNIKI